MAPDVPRFAVDSALVAALAAFREHRRDPIEVQHDAYLIDGGLGPVFYLTADGRVLEDSSDWDDEPLREVTGGDAYRALVVGARKTKISRLLGLLPPRPVNAETCSRCRGERFASFLPGEHTPSMVCFDCNGLGWREP